MDAIEKNDSIILKGTNFKGTNFKEKPIFAFFEDAKFDDLILQLMSKYGESITNGEPIKGKEELNFGDRRKNPVRPVPIPLQPYFHPFYCTTLLVVGSEESDALVLTSPIAENVRRLFGFSKWSRKDENYEDMLETIEKNTRFVPLTYNCSIAKLKKNWHKEVHLRKRDTVELYVVPKPLEYFPMLFIGCSMDNIRSMYDNITALMISRNDPIYYCPCTFSWAIFRPIIFMTFERHIEYRQRIPGIDVTDDEFVLRRSEWLWRETRYMVSDCRCRCNTAVLPPKRQYSSTTWESLEELFYNYDFCNRVSLPPLYSQQDSTCQKCRND
mgnify:CR=1 FL=1